MFRLVFIENSGYYLCLDGLKPVPLVKFFTDKTLPKPQDQMFNSGNIIFTRDNYIIFPVIATVKNLLTATGDLAPPSALYLVRFAKTTDKKVTRVNFEKGSLISGSMLRYFDGNTITEYGFSQTPIITEGMVTVETIPKIKTSTQSSYNPVAGSTTEFYRDETDVENFSSEDELPANLPILDGFSEMIDALPSLSVLRPFTYNQSFKAVFQWQDFAGLEHTSKPSLVQTISQEVSPVIKINRIVRRYYLLQMDGTYIKDDTKSDELKSQTWEISIPSVEAQIMVENIANLTEKENTWIELYKTRVQTDSPFQAEVGATNLFYLHSVLQNTGTRLSSFFLQERKDKNSGELRDSKELQSYDYSSLFNDTQEYLDLLNEGNTIIQPEGSHNVEEHDSKIYLGGIMSDGEQCKISERLNLNSAVVPVIFKTSSLHLPDEIAGIKSQDNNIVLFLKGHDKKYIYNESFNTYRSIQSPKFTSPVGNRSFEVIQEGIVFDTKKGIYLLGRDNAHDYLGLNVDDLKELDIVDVQTHPTLKEIRFLTSSGRLLIYNYLFKAWTEGADRNVHSIASVGEDVFYMDKTGSILKEDRLQSYDSSMFETGWIDFRDVQNYKRLKGIRLIGEFKNLSTVRVSIGYNFDDNLDQGEVRNIPEIMGDLGLTSINTLDWLPETQKCNSIKVRAEFGANGNKPFVFSQLGFVMGFAGAPYKITESLIFGV